MDESQYQWPSQLRTHPALRIEQIPPMGPPQVLADFTEAILGAHAAYQLDKDCFADGSGDDGNSDEGETDEGGPMEGGGETGDASLSDGASKVGCACRSDGQSSSTGALLGLLGLASLVYGRRRRRMHA
jgi:MYXO-CTERM domain-containing protein